MSDTTRYVQLTRSEDSAPAGAYIGYIYTSEIDEKNKECIFSVAFWGGFIDGEYKEGDDFDGLYHDINLICDYCDGEPLDDTMIALLNALNQSYPEDNMQLKCENLPYVQDISIGLVLGECECIDDKGNLATYLYLDKFVPIGDVCNGKCTIPPIQRLSEEDKQCQE